MPCLPTVDALLAVPPSERTAYHQGVHKAYRDAEDRLNVLVAIRIACNDGHWPVTPREGLYAQRYQERYSTTRLLMERCDAATLTYLLRARGLTVEQLDDTWFSVTWPTHRVEVLPIEQFIRYAAGVVLLYEEACARHATRRAA